MKFYFRDGERIVGPVRGSTLKDLARAGMITPETLIRSVDSRKWRPAVRYTLFDDRKDKPLAPPPPPTPEPVAAGPEADGVDDAAPLPTAAAGFPRGAARLTSVDYHSALMAATSSQNRAARSTRVIVLFVVGAVLASALLVWGGSLLLQAFAPASQPEVQEPAAGTNKWSDPSAVLHIGDASLSITAIRLGRVPISNAIGGDSLSKDSHLAIWIKVTNTTTSKKIDYLGYEQQESTKRLLELTDNHNNSYSHTPFGFVTRVKGAAGDESLYPGKSVEDVLLFEVPVEGVEYLRLRISCEPFGGKDDAQFQIPASAIHRERV